MGESERIAGLHNPIALELIPARRDSQAVCFVGIRRVGQVVMLVGSAEASTGAVGIALRSIGHVSLDRVDSPRAAHRSYKAASLVDVPARPLLALSFRIHIEAALYTTFERHAAPILVCAGCRADAFVVVGRALPQGYACEDD